jgi:urea transport system permease protein
MAAALGISTRRVDALTFALGAALAGVAGCIVGHLYNVKTDMGTDYVIDAFVVVILGGVGQFAGTVTGGALIGTGNSVIAKFLGNEPMARVLVLLLVIAFIQFRPSGLFAPRERVYD